MALGILVGLPKKPGSEGSARLAESSTPLLLPGPLHKPGLRASSTFPTGTIQAPEGTPRS